MVDSNENYSDLSYVQKKGRQFKQQRLPASITKFNIKYMSIFIFGVSMFFLIFGIIMFVYIKNTEFVIDYTNCTPDINIPETTCREYLKRAVSDISLELCRCTVNFTLNKPIKRQVYMYYRVEKFYQNERSYAKSIDFNQLSGSLSAPSSDCEPYRTRTVNSKTYYIAPCGTIANTMFNDSFSLILSSENKTVPVIRTGIAYPYDKKFRYNNPSTWNGTINPPYWRKTVMELDPLNPENNGYQNEDLMVWLRPAAFESPRKLHRIIDHKNAPFKDGLPSSTYSLVVEYNFPVAMFGGRKSIILSHSNWLGTTSLFLPVAYVIVAILSIIVALVLLLSSKFTK